MFEQRLTFRLQAHWDTTRREAVMPEFGQFNVGPISDIWQQCMLFTVQPSAPGAPAAVQFYKIGDGLRKLYSQDPTGMTVTTAQKHFEGAKIVARMADIIDNPRAMVEDGQFVNARGKMVKYRSCLLPFGKDGKVTHIVTGLSWKEF